jgi:hypothetical protein
MGFKLKVSILQDINISYEKRMEKKFFLGPWWEGFQRQNTNYKARNKVKL